MTPVTADHELVKAKVAAGLPVADAITVTERQLTHDAALAAATTDKAPAEVPAEAPAVTPKKK